ncbi:hypothetical protein DXG01_005220 [Tephrocybe rancida]|nr:hypothetical protein DXG01_005220 [Tephrocybe rancida]
MLATLIKRTYAPNTDIAREHEPDPASPSETWRARPPLPLRERDRRALSRGRTSATRPPRPPTASRSGSRIPVPRTPPAKPSPPLWHVPETYPIASSVTPETPSEGLMAYDLAPVLPVSQYLAFIIGILEGKRSWDVLALCPIPSPHAAGE